MSAPGRSQALIPGARSAQGSPVSAARKKAAARTAAAAPDAASIPLRQVDWQPSLRLIASRYPTVGLYDAIADPADLEVVFAIESLTNPRIRDELGQVQLVPPEERIAGPGSTPIMAAFTHLNPEGSRFSDGSFGVYYAAQHLDTAIAEVSHHRALFLARTAEPAIDIDLRLIATALSAPLHDLRALREKQPAVYDPQHYGVSQPLGIALRTAGSWGVLYHSVRHRGGQCAGVFRPKALQPAREAAHIALHWDGQRITHWYEKRAPQTLQEAG
jgi:RES domain